MTRAKKLRPGRGQRNLDGTIHCMRCGRLLVQAAAIKRGYGRGCWRKRTNDQGTTTNDQSENQNTETADREVPAAGL